MEIKYKHVLLILFGISVCFLNFAAAEKGEAYSAQSPSGTYAFRFSQIATSGSSGGSENYRVKDTIKVAVNSQETQLSKNYAVFNPLGIGTYANNGVVIGSAEFRISWSEDDRPISFSHYNIFRARFNESKLGKELLAIEEYRQINTQPILMPEYFDNDLEPDTLYFYYVEMVQIDGTKTQWTPLFGARTGLVTSNQVLWYLLGEQELTPEQESEADANNDSKVDISDMIQKIKQ